MEVYLEWFITNWAIIVGLLALCYFIYNSLRKFISMPKLVRSEKVRVWILYAITEAEKEFGSGKGEVKLGKVYGEFTRTFPAIAKIITFETFKTMVDESLNAARVQLESEKLQEKIEVESNFKNAQVTELREKGKL